MHSQELVGPATRIAIERFTTDVVKKDIHHAWEGAGFPHTEADSDARPERTSLFKAYCSTVDWTDRKQASDALFAFRDIINSSASALNISYDLYGEQQWKDQLRRLHQAMERDRLTIDDSHLIHIPNSVALADEAWDSIQNSSAIDEHLIRLRTAITNKDPSLVIGLAKDLVESTAKIALTELDVSYSIKDSLNSLITKVREALKLHHLDIPGDKSGPDADRAAKGINKTLSGAANVVVGLDEFRNAAGTGHGRLRTVPGLGTRHSRLAVDAATLWCNLILTTLADKDAPWRTTD